MKKAIFSVLIVLLAMLAVTCDSAVLPSGLASGPDKAPPLETWTTLSINIENSNGRARAMSQTLNASSVNFYEVVFVYNISSTNPVTVRSTMTGTGGTFTSPWTVTVPTVNYNANNNTAVLFAGVETGKILIAIGSISDGGNLSGGDGSITFELSAITSVTDPFELTGAATDEVENPDDITGTVTVHQIGEGDDPVGATYKLNIPTGGVVVVNGAGTVTGATVTDPSPTFNIGNSTITTPVSGTLPAGDVTFEFEITPGSTIGYSKIYLAAPVIAINNSSHGTMGTNSVVTWHLQGGIDNSTLDTGTNEGGAVLIEVEAVTPKTAHITNPDTTPKGWASSAGAWTLTIAADDEDLVLTATASGFDNAVTFTWMVVDSAGDTPDPDTDDPFSIDGVSVSTVGSNTNDTLTIACTSEDLTTDGDEYYVYVVANKGTDNIASTVITITAKDPGNGSVTLPDPSWE